MRGRVRTACGREVTRAPTPEQEGSAGHALIETNASGLLPSQGGSLRALSCKSVLPIISSMKTTMHVFAPARPSPITAPYWSKKWSEAPTYRKVPLKSRPD